MKNLKKVFATIMILALVLALSVPAFADNERIKIEVWHRASADMGANVLEEAAAEYNASQDKYEIVCVYNSGEYKGLIQSMVAEAAAGKTPGISQIAWTWVNYLCQNFPTTSVTELEGGKELLSAFDENLVGLCSSPSGEVIGIPVANSCPIIYYNAEVCAKAGLDVNNLPKTWDELIEWAKTIVEKTDAEGFSFAAPPDFWLEEWLIEGFGGSIYNQAEDGTYVAHFGEQAAIDAMQGVADLYAEGTGVFLSGADAIKEAFSSGKLGIMIATIGWSTGFTTSCNFDWVAGSVVSCAGNPVTAPVGGSMFAITATDPEVKEGAWEFMKLLGSAKYIEAWSEATGYLPGRADVRDADSFKAYVEEHPYLNAGLNVITALNTPVAFPGDSALQLQDDFCNARDAIYVGQGKAADILPPLAETANELMNE